MGFYSQYGEDRWIRGHMVIPQHGFFVDIGAYDGGIFSNSLHFEELGWDGILVEPQVGLCKGRKMRLLESAVSNYNGQTAFFVCNNNLLSGIKSHGHRTMVPVITLDRLLDGVPRVDIMSIDTEGSELEILRAFSWNVPVDVMIIEHVNNAGPSRLVELTEVMMGAGYRLRYTSPVNAIFERIG